MNLTPRQIEVACAIRAYRHEHGIGPTFREIGAIVGLSKARVFEHVWELAQRRIVECDGIRSLEVIDDSLLPPMKRNTRIEYRGEVA